MRSALLLLVGTLAISACSPPESPVLLTSRADTVAFAAFEYFGGPAVWEHVRYVRFDFGSRAEGDTSRAGMRRHLWDRHTGDYRLETWRGDTLFVALFNVNTREGQVFRQGAPLDTAAARPWLNRAFGSYINDTYWLLMPTKMFDEGVTRTYEADSSNAQFDVVRLSFGDVGLTPGDRYWVHVDRSDGRVDGWKFHLQSMDASAIPAYVERTGYEDHRTPHGTARIATRHPRSGSDRVLYTDNVSLPELVDPEVFRDVQARM